MNATLLKRLFQAIHSGADQDVETLCRRIVDVEKKLGHERVAEDLELILKKTSNLKSERPPAHPGALTPLPTNRRDSAPLFHEVPLGGLRHDMILPHFVEKRFQRIEKELAARSRLATFGLRPRQRILLYGPPGCGKSLGAERLAWNTGLSLLKVRFDTLLSSYFGETVTNLRRVFDAAAANPCALFLDECDTLARSRTERNDVGEVNRITNALLEMLESYQGQGLIIAATNLDSSLDSALFRRFDEVLKIPLPSIDEIYRLLTMTLLALPTESAINWKEIARDMDGMSCSEVVQVGQNAAKHSVLEGRKKISAEDIRFALDEIHERLHQAP